MQGAEEMSHTCSDCNQPLHHAPMDKGYPGGDWVWACAICEWHSEDEEYSMVILKSMGLEQIVDLKIQVNAIREHVLKSNTSGWTDSLKEIMDKNTILLNALQVLSNSLTRRNYK